MTIRKIFGYLCFGLFICLVIGLFIFEIMNWHLSRWELLVKVWWVMPIGLVLYLGVGWGLEFWNSKTYKWYK